MRFIVQRKNNMRKSNMCEKIQNPTQPLSIDTKQYTTNKYYEKIITNFYTKIYFV